MTFLFVLGPVFGKIGIWADGIIMISLVYSAKGVFRSKFFPEKFQSTLLLIPLSIYIAFNNVLLQAVEYSAIAIFLLKPFRILITVVGCYHFVLEFIEKYGKEARQTIVEFIFSSILFHGCIMVYQMYDTDFKDWIYSFTTKGEFLSSFEYNFRMGGLSGGSGGAILSVVQRVGIILIPFIWNEKLIKRLYLITGGIIILCSVFICGRSGIYGFIVFLPITLYLFLESKKQFYIYLSIFAVLLLFTIGGIVSWLINYEENEQTTGIYHALSRNFDTFVNAKQYDEVNEETVGILQEMILLPTDLQTYILGNPYYLSEGNNRNYRVLESDIGYIRNLWGYGLFGTVIFCLPSLLLLWSTSQKVRSNKFAIIPFVIILEMLLFHAKEQFIMARMFMSTICILYFILEYTVEKE